MTVLRAFNKHRQIGCCNKSCYFGKNIRCLCCCGGRNHGVGFNQAIKNSAEIVREAAEKSNPDDPGEIRFEAWDRQLRLFV